MIDGTKIDAALHEALNQLIAARNTLETLTKLVGMTRSYTGQDPQGELLMTLERYVEAKATVALLKLIQSPDFFNALMRSAAEVEQP